MPAIRRGNKFFTPEDKPIVEPSSYFDMAPEDIMMLMDARGEVYIGHMFS
jgi:hypothetical protein